MMLAHESQLGNCPPIDFLTILLRGRTAELRYIAPLVNYGVMACQVSKVLAISSIDAGPAARGTLQFDGNFELPGAVLRLKRPTVRSKTGHVNRFIDSPSSLPDHVKLTKSDNLRIQNIVKG